MIRFSKNTFTNPAQIWISNIKCSYENLIKIVDIFDCKWITLTVDSVTEGSPFLTWIAKQRVKYFPKQHSEGYMEVSVIMPYNLLGSVLEKAICECPENIFILNSINAENWTEQLRHPFEKLITTGSVDMCISASLDENAVLIYLNRYSLLPNGVYKSIRALRFE